jgi:transposase InsO family protein
MRWGIWPTWVLVAIDHISRAVMAVAQLEGPNAGWAMEVLEQASLRHGHPRHLITDQDSLFTCDAFRDLLRQWQVKPRFAAVGKYGSIAVTERLIWTLKREWLARVPLIRGLNHLSGLLADFEMYWDRYRCHRRLHGATPSMLCQAQAWQTPDRSAKRVAARSGCGTSASSGSPSTSLPPESRPWARHSKERLSWRCQEASTYAGDTSFPLP